MLKKIKQNKNWVYMGIGLFAVSCIVFPYLLLGKGSYIQVHDQMDGEILNYIYQARYLLKGNIIPEFMNGMDKCAMLPPAPFGVIFYLLFSPYYAFVIMQWFVLLVGFAGMYKLCNKLEMHLEVSLFVSVLFCFMPFYPTYGLASLGQPMLVLAGLYLLEGKSFRGKNYIAYGMIALYAGFSSLSLIGFVWVVVGGCLTLWNIFRKRMKVAINVGFGTAVMVFIYILTNLDLIKSVLGVSGFVSHRKEMIVGETTNLLERAKSLLLVGGPYSNVYSICILIAALLSLIIVMCIRIYNRNITIDEYDNMQMKRISLRCIQIIYVMCVLFVGIFWAVMWNSEFVLKIRNMIGGMVTYFHADRVSWVFPFLWIVILACVLDIWLTAFFQMKNKFLKVCCFMAVLGLCLVQGVQEFRDGTLNKNFRLMLFEDYEQITWESFYMEDVFEEMKGYIEEDISSYSVVSLGMYPSVALYNGFTCADGYSNNYDLAYKHKFIKIIENEMNKNEVGKAYIKTWGNRLYLISAEYGVSTLIEKGSGITFKNLEYDLEAMKDLNIRYILSAGKITDAFEMGLELVRETPFYNDSSYYEIWLYKIP